MSTTFDGVQKLISFDVGTTEINVKVDIYSAWKLWTTQGDNAKYLPAVRTTGGDPIGGGQFMGDVYFLTNGWRLYVDHSCVVDGVLFSDNFPTPYMEAGGTNIVVNKVSSLSTVTNPVINVTGLPTSSEIADQVVNDLTPSIEAIPTEVATAVILSTPTVSQTAAAVRAELTNELTQIMELDTTPSALTPSQETMLLEMYQLLGLDPTKPLVVTNTSRTAGAAVTQAIAITPTQTTVTRTS